MAQQSTLGGDSLWVDLGDKEQREIRATMRHRRIARGETLIDRGAPPDDLFVVNFGLFEVRNSDNSGVVAEIGAGQLIGEIGFFAGSPRTASVVAARDSEVLEINRGEFDALAARCPAIGVAVTRALARRLAHIAPIVGMGNVARPSGHMRVLAIVAAGSGAIPDAFIELFRRTLARQNIEFLTSADAIKQRGGNEFDRFAAANWLSDLERDRELVICVADATPTEWTQTILRSADQALLVACGAPDALNPVEALALDLFPVARRRLIRLQAKRSSFADPSAPWLRLRDVFMVHHVSTQDDLDMRSLARFLSGKAIGYVAGGGGAFGPAHVGVFKAFREQGVTFDIFGGSSVGAAMAVNLALLWEPDEIRAATHELFVRRAALKRFTIPRYGLLDHGVVDDGLQHAYPGAMEDVWRPCFAVATDLSNYTMRIMRQGPVWEAVRATCAIPGVLPPFFDEAGHMLVDGGVVDNVPVGAMESLKSGPNLVVDLRPLTHRVYPFKYHAIPRRRELIARTLNFLPGKRKLPRCPGPAGVVQRSIFGNVRETTPPHGADDLLLRPPAFRGSSFMNWDRHADVLDAAYEWALRKIDELRADGNATLATMERVSKTT